jgi:hypothetical protein
MASGRTDFGAIMPHAFSHYSDDLPDQQNAKFFRAKNLRENSRNASRQFRNSLITPSR